MILLHTGLVVEEESGQRDSIGGWMDGRKDREEDEGEIKTNRGRTGASKCGGW